jgi:hypothetical protein
MWRTPEIIRYVKDRHLTNSWLMLVCKMVNSKGRLRNHQSTKQFLFNYTMVKDGI